MDTAHLLEVAMLTCFGVSWPLGALRMLKNKRQTNPPRKHGNIPL
mgnify:CR=1 FL=1